jgi:hypothetical protein
MSERPLGVGRWALVGVVVLFVATWALAVLLLVGRLVYGVVIR